MKKQRILAILGCSLSAIAIIAFPVYADPQAPLPALMVPADYSLQPNDVVSVSVLGFTDLTEPQVAVLPDGSVTVPLLGRVVVSGLSPLQLESKLTTLYAKYVINPSVSVSLVQKHPEYVSFSGWVQHPGTEPYRPGLHVIEALAEAGDALATGDLSKVTVTDQAGQKQALDLSHPETKRGTDVDVLLNVGDVVYVPQLRDEVIVVGEVLKPGSYPYLENETVEDAITQAGSTLPDADLGNARLEHNGVDGPLDLEAIQRRGDTSKNVKLSAGDRITVPEGNRAYVYGSVAHPGYYTLKPGDRILDALNACGGPLPTQGKVGPDLAKVNLVSVDKTKKIATVYHIDVQKYLDKGDMAGNPVLQANDVIYIHNRGQKADLGQILSDLGGIGSTAYMIHNGY
jgi:polysaccharide export outer membrane protein